MASEDGNCAFENGTEQYGTRMNMGKYQFEHRIRGRMDSRFTQVDVRFYIMVNLVNKSVRKYILDQPTICD